MSTHEQPGSGVDPIETRIENETRTALLELSALERSFRALDKRRDELRTQVKRNMKRLELTAFDVPGAAARIKRYTRTSVDNEKVQLVLGDRYKEVLKTVDVTQLDIEVGA
jgi:predicted phage-related endonuclease